MHEGADCRDVSLRTHEETEVRPRVATAESAARGRSRGHNPSVHGIEGFASRIVVPPLSKMVVMADDGLKTYRSAAVAAKASKTAAMETQCDRYLALRHGSRSGGSRSAGGGGVEGSGFG